MQPRVAAILAPACGLSRDCLLMEARMRLMCSGINAPGLRALAAAIMRENFCTFSVSAPAGERSAQSHCISIGKHLHAFEIPVEGAVRAAALPVLLATGLPPSAREQICFFPGSAAVWPVHAVRGCRRRRLQ